MKDRTYGRVSSDSEDSSTAELVQPRRRAHSRSRARSHSRARSTGRDTEEEMYLPGKKHAERWKAFMRSSGGPNNGEGIEMTGSTATSPRPLAGSSRGNRGEVSAGEEPAGPVRASSRASHRHDSTNAPRTEPQTSSRRGSRVSVKPVYASHDEEAHFRKIFTGHVKVKQQPPTPMGAVLAVLGSPSDLRGQIPPGEKRDTKKSWVAIALNIVGILFCFAAGGLWAANGAFSYSDNKQSTMARELICAVPLGALQGELTASIQIVVATLVPAFLGMIAVAGIMGTLVESLCCFLGDSWGGLANATLGNIVEVIVSLICLFKCQIEIVQTSLVGSMLSNLLLVLGMSFFMGGIRFGKHRTVGMAVRNTGQAFNSEAANPNQSLLITAVTGYLIPIGFSVSFSSLSTVTANTLEISRFTAIFLLLNYVFFMIFKLFTHKHVLEKNYNGYHFNHAKSMHDKLDSHGRLQPAMEAENRQLRQDRLGDAEPNKMDAEDAWAEKKAIDQDKAASYEKTISAAHQKEVAFRHQNKDKKADDEKKIRQEATAKLQNLEARITIDEEHKNKNTFGSRKHGNKLIKLKEMGIAANDGGAEDDEEDDEEDNQLNWLVLTISLTLFGALVAITSEALVDSLTLAGTLFNIPAAWLGLIILPIVGNVVEHYTSVTAAMKDKLNMSIETAIGSSVQIGLCVLPFVVLIGWIFDKPLSMDFGPFLSILLVMSVLISTIADGEANWLEGAMLMSLYVAIAVAAFFYPALGTSANPTTKC